ncbi:MAG: carbohydrate ABC transporter permease [Cellulosilyticaceae bacterium]
MGRLGRKLAIRCVVLCMVGLIFFPIIYILSHSLKDPLVIQKLYTSREVLANEKLWVMPFILHFGQYIESLLQTSTFLMMFWNTLCLVVPIVCLQLFIGILAAFGFAKFKFWGSETLFFIYVIIMLMPFQVTLVPNYIILKSLGLIGHYGSLILPGIYHTFSVFFLKQFIEGIDTCFIEQGQIDGCNEWKVLWWIITPMCKPVLGTTAVLLFIEYWNMVEQPIVFIDKVERLPLSVFLSSISEQHIGIAFACSLFYMILPIILAMSLQEDMKEGLSIVALK